MGGEERFAALVSDVAREVIRRRSSDACCGDLSLEQFETLQTVARSDQAKEPSTMGSLSTALGVDISTMSRNVSVLERNGYLARLRSADDGRIVHVRLTPKGKGALVNLQCGERDVFAGVFDAIPATERDKVIEALESLRACLIGAGTATDCCPPMSIRRRSS